MADLTQYLTTKYNRMIAEISADLGKMSDDLTSTQNIIRALKNPGMSLDGAPLTLNRVQIMEAGDIRIIPPAPSLDTCTQNKNGVKSKKEIDTQLSMQMV